MAARLTSSLRDFHDMPLACSALVKHRLAMNTWSSQWARYEDERPLFVQPDTNKTAVMVNTVLQRHKFFRAGAGTHTYKCRNGLLGLSDFDIQSGDVIFRCHGNPPLDQED